MNKEDGTNFFLVDRQFPGPVDVDLPSRVERLVVSNVKNVREIARSNGVLTEVFISDATGLETLSCRKNSITTLELASCNSLKNLFCDENKIAEIDVSDLENLQEFVCSRNKIESLDLSKCNKLFLLVCSQNYINRICFPRHVYGLTEFVCASNLLAEIDLAIMPNLKILNCANNKIAELDLSQVPQIEMIDCSGNNIQTLDITNNPNIKELKCDSETKIKRQKGRFVNIMRIEKEAQSSDHPDGRRPDAHAAEADERDFLSSERQELQNKRKHPEGLVGIDEIKSRLRALVNRIRFRF